MTLPERHGDGRVRAVIDAVYPSVDAGRFAAKRCAGDEVVIEADCFTDGHDAVRAVLRWRAEETHHWHEVEMQPLGNDRWRASFMPREPGRYRYTVAAWVDRFASWQRDFARREDAADIRVAALAGAELAAEIAARAKGDDQAALMEGVAVFRNTCSQDLKKQAAKKILPVALRYPDRSLETAWPVEMPLTVESERARYSTWYEMFPRSAGAPGKHGTLKDVIARLPYIAELGFDVLYLPPIHPIGRTKRKGRNNALAAAPDDVGSPWAIGSAEGGHKAVHPALGTRNDFVALVEKAHELNIEIALDIAFQCSPDHPYVKEHPDWFRKRPDGSIQYAENPPKKYEDIYPFDFECADWKNLWAELKSVFEFWLGHGVRIFRVDNPHTKSFAFWEWVINDLKKKDSEIIFLAEAFTRPKVMHRLAKLGFTQSYTYFTWRNTKAELVSYFSQLASSEEKQYFRPNVWPNTPDILSETLQHGGRAAFMQRVVLAATLAASYGIYGPAYELADARPREPGSEEYLDSEKYQLRQWDLERPDSLRAFIATLNRIRRDNPALQTDEGLRFFSSDNEQLLCYAKSRDENTIVCVVNLDPHNVHSGWIELDLAALGLPAEGSYQMHDLLGGGRYQWQGARNFVKLDPARTPAHVFRVRHHVRSEHDFDYFA